MSASAEFVLDDLLFDADVDRHRAEVEADQDARLERLKRLKESQQMVASCYEDICGDIPEAVDAAEQWLRETEQYIAAERAAMTAPPPKVTKVEQPKVRGARATLPRRGHVGAHTRPAARPAGRRSSSASRDGPDDPSDEPPRHSACRPLTHSGSGSAPWRSMGGRGG
jgi:hypothetical protein